MTDLVAVTFRFAPHKLRKFQDPRRPKRYKYGEYRTGSEELLHTNHPSPPVSSNTQVYISHYIITTKNQSTQLPSTISSISPVTQEIPLLICETDVLGADVSHPNLFLEGYIKLLAWMQAQNLFADAGDAISIRNEEMAARIEELTHRVLHNSGSFPPWRTGWQCCWRQNQFWPPRVS